MGTTIMDLPAVLIWRDHLSHVGQAHGALLVDLLAYHGSTTPERDAGWALHLLETRGEIKRSRRKPQPTAQQRWAGAGGSFAVQGGGAPEVCWVWERVA